MTKQLKGILVASSILVVAVATYLFLKPKSPKSNSKDTELKDLQDKIWGHMVTVIPDIAPFKTSYVHTDAFKDAAYLKAWSDAIDNNAITFVYNNVTYKTTDGTGV
jgi:hypothetical protein